MNEYDSAEGDFCHQNIGELQGGGIGFAINQAFAEAMRDCTNRPSLTKKRKVIIEIEFEPGSSALDDAGMGLGTVGITARTKTNFPPRAGAVEYLSVKTKQVGNEKIVTARFTQGALLSAGN